MFRFEFWLGYLSGKVDGSRKVWTSMREPGQLVPFGSKLRECALLCQRCDLRSVSLLMHKISILDLFDLNSGELKTTGLSLHSLEAFSCCLRFLLERRVTGTDSIINVCAGHDL